MSTDLREAGRKRRPDAPIRREVIVVGGGQAGLAIGYFLARQGRDFAILDAGSEPAGAWRARWQSLRLFTPVRYSSLPGMRMPGHPDAYPTRDEVAAYLTEYAQHYDLPLELNSPVRSLTRADGRYTLTLDDRRTYEAEQVVVATGPFQVPFVPALAQRLDPEVTQLHSSAYRAPEDVARGPVLIVGGGNTGFQLAEELSAAHEVHLSIGSRQTPLPQRILGRGVANRLEEKHIVIHGADLDRDGEYGGRTTALGAPLEAELPVACGQLDRTDTRR